MIDAKSLEDRVLEALASPQRRKILSTLVKAYPKALTVTELQRALGVPRTTLWHHLRVLRDAYLVELNGSRRGFRARYRALHLYFNGERLHVEGVSP